MQRYKTKSEKRRALIRFENLALRLYISNAMSDKDLEAVKKIAKLRIKQQQ
tara:strand:+ start:184 stop:336 length:153 start_codon:yes stop_codon:yes gene_type:complete